MTKQNETDIPPARTAERREKQTKDAAEEANGKKMIWN